MNKRTLAVALIVAGLFVWWACANDIILQTPPEYWEIKQQGGGK